MISSRDSPTPRTKTPLGRPAAPGTVMSAKATADIVSAILRQIQPCADRQVNPGPGAERIRVAINLKLNRDGSLAAPPRVVNHDGLDVENRRYLDRVDDLAVADLRRLCTASRAARRTCMTSPMAGAASPCATSFPARTCP